MDTPQKIEARQQALLDIFSDQYTFRIPRYQRPYAWGTEHAGQLLDDLIDALGENTGEDIEQVTPYFLGSIVLVRHVAERNVVDVIDGQQRLITLSLLLACLREYLPDHVENLDQRLRQRGDALLGQPDVPRLSLRDRDQDFYVEKIIKHDGLDGVVDETQLSDSKRNLLQNSRLLREKLSKLEPSTIERLAKYMILRCYLVVVETADLSSGYRIFSVLNSRGRDLKATDILKSDIIGKLPENDRDVYNKKWEDAEEYLEREGFLELITHIRMIYRKTKLRNLLDEMREWNRRSKTRPVSPANVCT